MTFVCSLFIKKRPLAGVDEKWQSQSSGAGKYFPQ
jgi:hypothetical protein